MNNGLSAYTINGVDNPTLTLVRGTTYTFNITESGNHPFDIKTVKSTGTGNRFTNGVTGNGTTNGTLTFAVPLDAPDQLFYDCEVHIAMFGIINIVPEPGTLTLLVAGIVTLSGRRRSAKNRPASRD